MKKTTALFLVLFGLNAFGKGPLFAGFAPMPKRQTVAPKVDKQVDKVTTVELPEVEIPSDEEIAQTCHTYYKDCRGKGRSHAQCSAVRDYCTPGSLRM